MPEYEYNDKLSLAQNKKLQKMYNTMRDVGSVARGRRERHKPPMNFLCPPITNLTVLARYESSNFKYIEV